MKPIEFCATSVDCVITTVLSVRSITYYFSAFARPFEDGGQRRDFKGRGEDILIDVGRATFHMAQ